MKDFYRTSKAQNPRRLTIAKPFDDFQLMSEGEGNNLVFWVGMVMGKWLAVIRVRVMGDGVDDEEGDQIVMTATTAH